MQGFHIHNEDSERFGLRGGNKQEGEKESVAEEMKSSEEKCRPLS